MSQTSFIFLPGFMCDGRLFAPQMKALRDEGHACAAADLSGARTIEALAEAILAQAPDCFAPVGLSMGGIVALELYRQAPERISHVALLNTTFRADSAGAQRMVQLDRVRQGELDLVLREELKPNYMHPANRSPARLDLLADMAAKLGETAFESQTAALMARQDYEEVLALIKCPTLVLTGDSDAICPPDLHREIAAAVQNSRLVIVPQCGHLSSLEQPDSVTAALRDLTREPSEAGVHARELIHHSEEQSA